jgi:hypothetical protein
MSGEERADRPYLPVVDALVLDEAQAAELRNVIGASRVRGACVAVERSAAVHQLLFLHHISLFAFDTPAAYD